MFIARQGTVLCLIRLTRQNKTGDGSLSEQDRVNKTGDGSLSYSVISQG